MLRQEQSQDNRLSQHNPKKQSYNQFISELKRILPHVHKPEDIIRAEVNTALKVNNLKNVNSNLIVQAMLADPEVLEEAQSAAQSILKENEQ
jgi:hypothetical protein